MKAMMVPSSQLTEDEAEEPGLEGKEGEGWVFCLRTSHFSQSTSGS